MSCCIFMATTWTSTVVFGRKFDRPSTAYSRWKPRQKITSVASKPDAASILCRLSQSLVNLRSELLSFLEDPVLDSAILPKQKQTLAKRAHAALCLVSNTYVILMILSYYCNFAKSYYDNKMCCMKDQAVDDAQFKGIEKVKGDHPAHQF